MTYENKNKFEEKLQKLRDAGVIDMELSFGCLITLNYADDDNVFKLGFLTGPYRDQYEAKSVEYKNLEYFARCDIENILGHDLLYGRVCRWIETYVRIIPLINYSKETYLIDRIMGNIGTLWHRKDLPLSQQENKEEILDFILSLIPKDGIS